MVSIYNEFRPVPRAEKDPTKTYVIGQDEMSETTDLVLGATEKRGVGVELRRSRRRRKGETGESIELDEHVGAGSLQPERLVELDRSPDQNSPVNQASKVRTSSGVKGENPTTAETVAETSVDFSLG